jgi:hypothetical protein
MGPRHAGRPLLQARERRVGVKLVSDGAGVFPGLVSFAEFYLQIADFS